MEADFVVKKCEFFFEKVWRLRKKSYLCTPFEKRVADKAESSDERLAQKEKNLKIFSKRFGSLKIMRTFAAPFEKRVLARENEKFIEKTDLLYKKQVPRKNTIYREALILLKGL